MSFCNYSRSDNPSGFKYLSRYLHDRFKFTDQSAYLRMLSVLWWTLATTKTQRSIICWTVSWNKTILTLFGWILMTYQVQRLFRLAPWAITRQRSLHLVLSLLHLEDGLMARSAKEVVNEHFHIKERTLCVCHDQEWRELGRLLQGVRCTLSHHSAFWSILEQTTPSFHIGKSMLRQSCAWVWPSPQDHTL